MEEINGYRQSEQDRRLLALEEQMQKTYKHIATTNEEMGSVKKDVAWLVRFFWIIATASIGGLITGLVNLLINS